MSTFLESMVPFVTFEQQVEVLGKWYTCRIVKQAFKPELVGFAGLIDGILFISDDVPGAYREYFFWHEVMCVERRNRQGCAQTLKEELERVPEPMRRDYIAYRCECFEALMNFYAAKPPVFYQEIVTSYQYLMSLLEG